MTDGLEGVVATSTRLSHVDGQAGQLVLSGYAVEDLAPHASFEEVGYLFLHGRLPEPSQRCIHAETCRTEDASPCSHRSSSRSCCCAGAAHGHPSDGGGYPQPRP